MVIVHVLRGRLPIQVLIPETEYTACQASRLG
jgi:hypothetical protein